MIKDLEIMYNIAPLFEKELIIWGAGYDGSTILEDIIEMRAGTHGIMVCDSDCTKWRGEVCNIEIISPDTLEEYLKSANLNNISLCIMVQNPDVQEEILKEIEKMELGELAIYTSFGVRCGIYYGLRSSYINESFRKKKIKENVIHTKQVRGSIYNKLFEYLAYLPLHNDEIIMVYQPENAGWCSMYASIKQYGKNVIDICALRNVSYLEVGIQKLLDMKSAKIISVIKDPISGDVWNMWDNIDLFGVHGTIPDMRKVEEFRYGKEFENIQSEWYEHQMQKLCGLNILNCSFDREKGYQIIESGNIELLLLKAERLDELKPVIGDFLGIQDFQIYHTDVCEKKQNRFAYKEYINKFTLSCEKIESIFREDKFVKHFYTDEECEDFIENYRNEGIK